MQSILSVLALLAAVVVADAPTADPVPALPATGSAPAGCSPDYPNTFTIINTQLPGATSKRTPPQEGPASTIYLTLSGGILRDEAARFGYIASNNQFQFDNPIQAGAIITEGWSACSNNTLALGGSTVFWQCTSGDFYNLYNIPIRTGCIPINLSIVAGTPTVALSSIPAGATTAADTYPSTTAIVITSSSSPIASSYAATTSSSPTPVVYSTSAVSSSAAPSSAAASTSAKPTSAAPASSSPAATSYTGAAQPTAVAGSFFALLAGAVGVALI